MGDSDLHEFRAEVKQVFASCGTLAIEGTGVGECVELIGELKELNLAVGGLVVALMGHVHAVQAAVAKERSAGDESGEVLRGAPDTGDRRSELLPGRDATLSEVMARTGKQSKRSASNEVRSAQVANKSFPRFVGLMRQGKISGDYLDILRSAVKTPGLADRARAEEDHLITLALAQGVDEFRTSMRAWVFRHAPARAEQQVKAAERREKINLYPDVDGYRVFGWVTSFNGAVLNNAIRQQVGVPARGDYRDQGERNAEALIQIAHHSQVSGHPTTGVGLGDSQLAANVRTGGERLAGAAAATEVPRGAGAFVQDSVPAQSGAPAEISGCNGTWGDPSDTRSRRRDAGVATGAGPSIETGVETGSSGAFGVPRPSRGGALRHQVLVHVPLTTLVRTEEAIEAGCGVIAGQKSSEVQRNRAKRHGASEVMPKGQGEQTGIAGNSIHGEDATVGWPSGAVPYRSSKKASAGQRASSGGHAPSLTGEVPPPDTHPQDTGLDLFSSSGPPPAWTVDGAIGRSPQEDSDLLDESVSTLSADGNASASDVNCSGLPDEGYSVTPGARFGTLGTGTSAVPESGDSGPPDSRFSEPPEFGLDCPTVGGGLGRRGACLESREDTERDLGTMLGMIRAGIDISMLDGFAPARLSDGSPLAPTQLAQLLCDSDLARVVFTAHGEPLDVSRSQRLFSPRQTKAVIARDMHCRFPGCSRGPEVGQVHHAQEWEKGGSTVIDNAVLLCFAHHRYVHSKQITIAHHAGGFLFTESDGTLVGVTRHASALAA